MITYLVVEQDTREALENEVMDNFKRGYTCMGGVSLALIPIPGMYGAISYQSVWLQAMVYVGGKISDAKPNS